MNNDENARPGGAEAGIDGDGSTRTTVRLDQIRTDGGTQIRAEIDESVVAEYAEAISGGSHFPSVKVFDDGKHKWLADGFHRFLAGQRAGKEFINCAIVKGSLRDAVLHAVGANGSHGLRRTNADKRRAVMRMLEDEEWRLFTDREIARRCNVSHVLVGSLRQTLNEPGTGNFSSAEATANPPHWKSFQCQRTREPRILIWLSPLMLQKPG